MPGCQVYFIVIIFHYKFQSFGLDFLFGWILSNKKSTFLKEIKRYFSLILTYQNPKTLKITHLKPIQS